MAVICHGCFTLSKIYTHEGAYLFVQSGLKMQRFVRHEKVPGGFNGGRLSLALWSILDLSDHQLHSAPVRQRREKAYSN